MRGQGLADRAASARPSGMLDRATEMEILAAFRASRSDLRPALEVRGVRVRLNVFRLASLTRARSPEDGFFLNLSAAVIEAGPEAWSYLAPAFEGDRFARNRLRELTRPRLEDLRNRLDPRDAAASRPGLPDTRCDGAPEEQAYLRRILEFFQGTSGFPEAFPPHLQLRISRRMTAKLGLFSHRGGVYRITLSQRLFRPGIESILWDTLRHEMAHLADHYTSPEGKTSHGPRWREWARLLGARPEPRCSPAEALRIVQANRGTRRGFFGPRKAQPPVLRDPPGWLEWRKTNPQPRAE